MNELTVSPSFDALGVTIRKALDRTTPKVSTPELDRDLLWKSLLAQVCRVERLMKAMGYTKDEIRGCIEADLSLLNRIKEGIWESNA